MKRALFFLGVVLLPYVTNGQVDYLPPSGFGMDGSYYKNPDIHAVRIEPTTWRIGKMEPPLSLGRAFLLAKKSLDQLFPNTKKNPNGYEINLSYDAPPRTGQLVNVLNCWYNYLR